jgi:hypothetical protein
VSSARHQDFLRWAADSQERLALNLEREGRAEYAERAWARAAAARERADAAQRRSRRERSRDAGGRRLSAT